MKKKVEPKATGTKEWAICNVNIYDGCEHNCGYGYCRAMKCIYPGKMPLVEWEKPTLNEEAFFAKPPITKVKGNAERRKRGNPDLLDIMFPTVHDITPNNLEWCRLKLRQLLRAGLTVLITTKPHLDCIITLCNDLEPWKDQITFRFTITTRNNELLKYWEPGAPPYEERFEALKYAFSAGYKTSISMEPCLDINDSVELAKILLPFVTQGDAGIWIGPAKQLKQRMVKKAPEDLAMATALDNQKYTKLNPKLRSVLEALAEIPKVAFKENSYFELNDLTLEVSGGQKRKVLEIDRAVSPIERPIINDMKQQFPKIKKPVDPKRRAAALKAWDTMRKRAAQTGVVA